jgi:hypothetical protein
MRSAAHRDLLPKAETQQAATQIEARLPSCCTQVLERLKDPLKSLIARDDPYIAYAVLAHARLLVQRAPFIFEQDYVAFYCRTHDPW